MERIPISKDTQFLTLPDRMCFVILSRSDSFYGSFALTNKIKRLYVRLPLKYIDNMLLNCQLCYSISEVLHFLLPLYTLIILRPGIHVQQWLLPYLNPMQDRAAKSRKDTMMNRKLAVIIVANQSSRTKLEHWKQNHYIDPVCGVT